MTQDVDAVINDALGLLSRIGSMGRTELAGLVPGISKEIIGKMERTGYIKPDKIEKDFWHVTTAGRKRIGEGPESNLVPARSTSIPSTSYDGAELRPYSGRPGAMDAFALPSLLGDGLHYRDGTITKDRK